LAYYVICAFGLGLYFWAGAVQMSVASLPRDFPIERLAYPVEIDGTIAASPAELTSAVQGRGTGTGVRIGEANGRVTESVLARSFSFQHRLFTYLPRDHGGRDLLPR
jgi:hypothetical protein